MITYLVDWGYGIFWDAVYKFSSLHTYIHRLHALQIIINLTLQWDYFAPPPLLAYNALESFKSFYTVIVDGLCAAMLAVAYITNTLCTVGREHSVTRSQ